ncbi:glycoside hydrolase family 16 protein [Sphaerobolus stellatus SS14]|nr:glycoside hydrolase family 16 protein [Sphaerobolus stellatus SS14]
MVLGRYLSLASLPLLAVATNIYTLNKQYAGPGFFDDWSFFGNFDNLTNGNANYVSKPVGTEKQLTYVNDVGNAIIKVDNTTKLTGGFRNTVRIQTNALHGAGSLWVADMLHVPYGCSVWPAWWSAAPNWPASGEIDTFEYVNAMPNAQMALHTLPGCKLDTTSKNNFTGLANSTDCSFEFNSNQGCVIQNVNKTGYGAGFAQAGGGMFVTEFATTGVSIWFFTRSQVPATLMNQTGDINITALGTPLANFPSTTCDISFIQPQHLTLNIDLCGDFAGNTEIFAQTCSGNCYADYVLGPPSVYDNAYFEIKSIRTYNDPSIPSAIFTPVAGNASQAAPPVFTGKPSGALRSVALQGSGLWCIVFIWAFWFRHQI